ncbi:MAG: hypothetical protein KF852_20615 [Saprospiraceae bacterium]|nr:hypothetical protein [Saprospiraceae bacterium]
MITNKLIIIITIAPHFLFGQSILDTYYRYAIGEWKSPSLFDVKSVYRADSTIDVYYTGDAARKLFNFQIDIDTVSPWGPGEMAFMINLQDDTLLCCNIEKMRINQPSCYRLLLLTDTMKVTISYKKGPLINDHIDGVKFSYKHVVPQSDPLYHCPEDEICNRFLLEEDFTGLLVVLYQSPDLVTKRIDPIEQRTFHVPSNGLLETLHAADPISFAMRGNAFYYADKNGTPVKRLSLMLREILSPGVLQLEKVNNYLSRFDPDEVYVVPLGYNQMARQLLNERFGKELIGNAEMYQVGRLKDLITK